GGYLKRADMGVFQITAQNSSEEFSYGGAYNTFSKNKTASITVHLDFGIR
ncbi:MAG: SIMPL domain-containing protein, partial [Bacteroidetes bacterium]|nr:SIMPL domain-containing protein [Bacteroidota bacterium]